MSSTYIFTLNHLHLKIFSIYGKIFAGILQQRIELDKECMFQYTQLRKEVPVLCVPCTVLYCTVLYCIQVRLMDGQTSVAPVLMRFQRGCQQVGKISS